MDSVPLIDRPSFWIAFGLAEIALPMVIPNKRWLGLAMLSLAGISFAVAIGWSPSEVRPPKLAIYLPVALAGSVGAAISRRLATDLWLKRIASKLAIDLEDWSILARARLPEFTMAGMPSPEEVRLETEYKSKFGEGIIQLMKPLVAGDRSYSDLRDTWLRVPYKTTNSAPSTAHLASTFFTKYGNGNLPIPVSKKWFDRGSTRSVTIYFAGALVLWFALFGLGKATGKEGPSAMQAPSIGGSGGTSGSVTIVKPGPIPRAWFTTIGTANRNIATGGRPKTLRFTKPVEAIVHAGQLPVKISYANGYLVVKLFTDQGFVVDEYGAKGIEVEAEVYH